ncbi:MAG: hypothetical protein IJP62_10020 [Treponema sp.]|nr:hypothetical protein [Treponema sp.]
MKRIFMLILLLQIGTLLFAEAENSSDAKSMPGEAPQQTFFLWKGTGTPLISVFSIDVEFLLRGVTNLGWGAGVRYERYIWNHLAGKIGFGHGTFHVKDTDEWCTTVSFSLFALYYPFTRELRGFYTGLGGYFDYVGYFGGETLPENVVDTFISVYPLIGYKLWFCRWLMLDFFGGYKVAFLPDDAVTFGDVDTIIGTGVKWGVSIKLNL